MSARVEMSLNPQACMLTTAWPEINVMKLYSEKIISKIDLGVGANVASDVVLMCVNLDTLNWR